MKIENNIIGNYRPIIRNNQSLSNNSTAESLEKVKDDVKLSSNEKKYFAKLYPENAKDVMEYHFYEKNGKMSGVKLGSNFDKRG